MSEKVFSSGSDRIGRLRDDPEFAAGVREVRERRIAQQQTASDSSDLDTSSVTRFVVIDHTTTGSRPPGVCLSRYGVAVTLSLQDSGRTLKVFLGDSPVATADEVAAQISCLD